MGLSDCFLDRGRCHRNPQKMCARTLNLQNPPDFVRPTLVMQLWTSLTCLGYDKCHCIKYNRQRMLTYVSRQNNEKCTKRTCLHTPAPADLIPARRVYLTGPTTPTGNNNGIVRPIKQVAHASYCALTRLLAARAGRSHPLRKIVGRWRTMTLPP